VNTSYCALRCYFCIYVPLTAGRFCSLAGPGEEDDIDKMVSCPKAGLTNEARAACPGEVSRREPTGATLSGM